MAHPKGLAQVCNLKTLYRLTPKKPASAFQWLRLSLANPSRSRPRLICGPSFRLEACRLCRPLRGEGGVHGGASPRADHRYLHSAPRAPRQYGGASFRPDASAALLIRMRCRAGKSLALLRRHGQFEGRARVRRWAKMTILPKRKDCGRMPEVIFRGFLRLRRDRKGFRARPAYAPAHACAQAHMHEPYKPFQSFHPSGCG